MFHCHVFFSVNLKNVTFNPRRMTFPVYLVMSKFYRVLLGITITGVMSDGFFCVSCIRDIYQLCNSDSTFIGSVKSELYQWGGDGVSQWSATLWRTISLLLCCVLCCPAGKKFVCMSWLCCRYTQILFIVLLISSLIKGSDSEWIFKCYYVFPRLL